MIEVIVTERRLEVKWNRCLWSYRVIILDIFLLFMLNGNILRCTVLIFVKSSYE